MISIPVTEQERINKCLATHGIASRRKADLLISTGKVKINHKTALVGDTVSPGDTVHIDDGITEREYVLYNKPRGVVTGPLAAMPALHPVGRLDKESEGLLLYTNDFRVIDRLLHPSYAREKEYEVTIREKATPRVVTILKRGIYTQEAEYAPAKQVAIIGDGHALRIILTEGKKHEIRRMLNALNLTIVTLKRVRLMDFSVRGISSGKTHTLTDIQKKKMLRALDLEE